MMKFIGALIVVLVLAFTATSASAECAWVLWQYEIVPVEAWSISGAHPNLRECSEDLIHLAQTYQKSGYKVGGLLPGARTVTYGQEATKGYLHCLPDTVDPRGTKTR